MKRYQLQLIELIRQYQLDTKTPQQTKTKVDWIQVLLMVERRLISNNICLGYLYLIQEDIEQLTDYPEYLHRLPDPEQLYRDGEPHIYIGRTVDEDLRVGYRFDGPLFVVNSGLIGYGKTNSIRVTLKSIHEYNLAHPEDIKIVIVLDRKGGDYADLPAMFGWKHYHVFDSLRLSLENPSGVPPKLWINHITKLFCARAGLKYAWVTMAKAIYALLEILNPRPTTRLIWPDFKLILDFLKSIPETTFASKVEYTRSLIQALETITCATDTTFRAFQGFRVQDLINNKQSVVIAMPNMDPSWARQLFMDILIYQVLKQRLQTSHRVDSVEIIFVADEADADVDQHMEHFFDDHMCPISEAFKMSRELGCGFILSVSSLKSVSRLVRENATVYQMFRENDYESTLMAARTLMLPQGGELTFGHLDIGMILFKQAGPWPHAMKVQIDSMLPSRKQVTQYDVHPYMPAKSLRDLPAVIAAAQQIRDVHEARKKGAKSKKNNDLELMVMDFLKLAAGHPYIPVARLFDEMGEIKFSVQKEIRQLIENQKLGVFKDVRIGKRNQSLIELKYQGFKWIGSRPNPSSQKGRGNVVHRAMAHWILWHCEGQSCQAFLEFELPGTSHPVDLAVPAGSLFDVYEVCSDGTQENILSHIQACFVQSQVVRQLIIVAPQKKQLKQLEQLIVSQLYLKPYIENIRYESIEPYVPKEIKPCE